MLEAVLLSLKLISAVVSLVVLQTQIDKAIAYLIHDILAFFLERFPVDIYI